LDGDLDIVVGHNPGGENTWAGITIIKFFSSDEIIIEDSYIFGHLKDL